ncbi:MAG: O-methyltransferase [Candidatus Zixiibacteriota bacterium]|nr:MAG: O-methyltransferase [candidate division Zixibacteria bacterium]
MQIITPELNEYMAALLPERDEVLQEMEEYAKQRRFPIIGPLCGTFLSQLALVIRARSIFEMGSGFGYSAYWFRKGMRDGGIVICTDGDAGNRDRALAYHGRTAFQSELHFRVGDAKEIITEYDEPFDIIFNDIDKEQYPAVPELAFPRLRAGGILITDNVLWSGRVIEEDDAKSTQGVREFNRILFGADLVLSSIIPIRDGLGLAVKLT